MEPNKNAERFDLLKSSNVRVTRDLESEPMPIGFRFLPNDHHLVLYYLTNKILKRPIPVDIIPTLPDMYGHDPDTLVHYDGTRNEVFYFTQLREEHKKSVVGMESGDWVQSGTQTAVYHGRTVIGFRKNRYFRSKTAQPLLVLGDGDTVYCVNEFRLNIDVVPRALLNHNLRKEVESWVVCRLFKITLG